jgi:muramoyltetrapeptide carboxypeptidase
MTAPPHLKSGDLVALVATARFIDPEQLKNSIAQIKSWGLKVSQGDNLTSVSNQFAGTDTERASDLQKAINDPETRAIICYRGGYGSIRLLDLVDFSGLITSPKWICGYSDITVFHSQLNKLRIESIHSTMPVNFETNSKEAIDSMRQALFGNTMEIVTENHDLNRYGSVTGELIGGNLSILHTLSGTDIDLDTKGKILVIEDLDEYLYHIDRMLHNLNRSGKLQQLAGLIVGGMTEMNDNDIPFGKGAIEIIAEIITEYNFPVCYNFPIGHITDNRSVILGKQYNLDVSKYGSTLRVT